MKKVYRIMPDEVAVVKQLGKLVNELKVPMPTVRFWQSASGQYDYYIQQVSVPGPKFVEYYQPDIKPETYWGLVIHEFAHHLDHTWNRGSRGHGDTFYGVFTGLLLREGLPPNIVLADEIVAYPRASRVAWRKMGNNLLKRKGK